MNELEHVEGSFYKSNCNQSGHLYLSVKIQPLRPTVTFFTVWITVAFLNTTSTTIVATGTLTYLLQHCGDLQNNINITLSDQDPEEARKNTFLFKNKCLSARFRCQREYVPCSRLEQYLDCGGGVEHVLQAEVAAAVQVVFAEVLNEL